MLCKKTQDIGEATIIGFTDAVNESPRETDFGSYKDDHEIIKAYNSGYDMGVGVVMDGTLNTRFPLPSRNQSLEKDYEMIGQIMALIILRRNKRSPETGKLCHHGANLMFSVPLANREYKSKFGVNMFEDYFRQDTERCKIRSIKTSASLQMDVEPKLLKGYHKFVSKLYQTKQYAGDHLVDLVNQKITRNKLDMLDNNMVRAIDYVCLRYGHILTWGWLGKGIDIDRESYIGMMDWWEETEGLSDREYNKHFLEWQKVLRRDRELFEGDF